MLQQCGFSRVNKETTSRSQSTIIILRNIYAQKPLTTFFDLNLNKIGGFFHKAIKLG
jgi:hypothetical protein